MAVRHIEFEVEGRGPFPFDMLRYDDCYPANEGQSAILEKMTWEPSTRVRVRLATTRDARGESQWRPAAGRWESFGWKIVGGRGSDVAGLEAPR